ncbi:MAG: spore germination protein, partial [Clostridiales bacterium]|nr:spore germination protein [Clostridiales bacterium]
TEIIEQVLNGMTALFIDKSDQCILIKSRGFEKRAVSQPVNETVILGPHEAFIENLHTNITLIRRIIRNKDLVAETIPVGNVNNVTCAILYIKGITNPKIIREVKRRINSIDIDFVSSDGTLDQLIEDHPLAIFPQILSTERPDRTASFLMEGRVAIIVDGAPNASIVPATFFDMMHTSEDYSLRWQYGTFMRIIRVISAALATFLPGFYLALTLYHHEMIPTELLASLAKARENIPFPIIVEILLMEISWELIREAGIRMPGVMGQTLGIIGAVILGEAVIAAELVSPILIIIVAITGLANLVIPNYPLGFGIRILRFVFVLLGAMAGFYGIATGIFIFGGLACSMKSFGVPYLSPVAPRAKASPDIIPRMPIWLQKERPDIINPKQRRRSRGIIRGWVKQDGREDKPQ